MGPHGAKPWTYRAGPGPWPGYNLILLPIVIMMGLLSTTTIVQAGRNQGGGSYLGDVNVSAILDSFSVSYDKRVRPNYGGDSWSNPNIIPDYDYLTEASVQIDPEQTNSVSNVIPLRIPRNVTPLSSNEPIHNLSRAPGRSKDPDMTPPRPEITPGKLLDTISLIPVTSAASAVRKRSRQMSPVLTSMENISKQREKEVKKTRKIKSQKGKRRKPTRVKTLDDDSDSLSESRIVLQDESTDEEWKENNSTGCGENYSETKKVTTGANVFDAIDGQMKDAHADMCDGCGKIANKIFEFCENV